MCENAKNTKNLFDTAEIICYTGGEVISLHNNSYTNPQFSHTITTNRRKKIRIHYHKEYEVYYLINGTTKYFIDDKIFFLEPGSFVIIPPHSYHMTDSEMCLHNERIVISFSEDLVTPEIAPVLKELCNKNVIVLPQSKLLKAENILELMEKEDSIRENYENSEYLINLYIQQLLIFLHRHQTTETQYLSETEKLIHQISKYISENYSSPLSLKTLSKEFGISENHLSRKFKEFTDIGLKDYINHIRLLNAENLLENTTMSMTQIANHCGFSDSNYFSTLFKKFKGISPIKYSQKFR